MFCRHALPGMLVLGPDASGTITRRVCSFSQQPTGRAGAQQASGSGVHICVRQSHTAAKSQAAGRAAVLRGCDRSLWMPACVTQGSQDGGRTSLGVGVANTGGGIFKSAAVAVLRAERRLMSTGDITRCAGARSPRAAARQCALTSRSGLCNLHCHQHSLRQR